ncbi:unnamed protein product [Closterium sp. Naga37s-1]|nr:unnamed protein product [Closterium sp. Naga37s-1]
MDPHHNPDELMGEEELNNSFSVESFFAEETATPAVSAPPPAKRVCAAASSSSTPVAPPVAPARPPVTPLMAPVAGPSNAAPASSAPAQEVGPTPALSITGRFSRLRRNRDTIGVIVASIVRDTESVVVILFPESLEAHRSRIVTRVRSVLRGRDFAGGRVPAFEASAGEILRLPRKSYYRHVFQWQSVDDANRFRRLFPISYRFSEGPSAEIKLFQDPNPDFSAAKARGETILVLRNIPIGISTEDIRNLLVTNRSVEGVKWLSDLSFFHKLYDPYDESFLPQLLGVPVASPNDPLFEAIPAVIWLPDVQEPILVNVSSHSIIGQHSAVVSFKADPGMMFIGTDVEVKVWTCGLCAFRCGWALDSAMEHMASHAHTSALQTLSGRSSPIEEFGEMKAHEFNQHATIAGFLAQG